MAMQIGQQITVDFDVPAQMRDGVTLRANVYRPVGEGPWPVLLTRLPYGKDFPLGTNVLDPAQVARRGYVVIVQDTRGRMTSEGEWVPFNNEAADGYDTVQWAAQLPYSNGSVGMYGASYYGFTQWSAAVLIHLLSRQWFHLSPGATRSMALSFVAERWNLVLPQAGI